MPSPHLGTTTESNLPSFTVSELSAALKRMVEDAFGFVRVKGEISQPKVAASGHCYLRFKDESAVLDGVIWRGTMSKLSIRPEEGMEVIASGRLTTYQGRSSYQIIVESLELAGEGARLKLLEERRKKLAAEGLFDEARKKNLFWLPDVIGVVTSPTGAVIRDILHRIADRFPRRVIVWPVKVQGERAAEEVAAAIVGFNALKSDSSIPRPDVIIVARGGGSLEDLWAFNEEVVVRAAAASAIPLIAAVGHETDWTLIDHAADRRAPTPTAAAELAVPVRLDLLAGVQTAHGRLTQAMTRKLEENRIHLEGLVRGIPRLNTIVAQKTQDLDAVSERLALGPRTLLQTKAQDLVVLTARLNLDRFSHDIRLQTNEMSALAKRLMQAGRRAIADSASRLEAMVARLESVSPNRVLERGYAMVTAGGGQVISKAAAAVPGDAWSVKFSDGNVGVHVDGAAPKRARAALKKSDNADQGRLL